MALRSAEVTLEPIEVVREDRVTLGAEAPPGEASLDLMSIGRAEPRQLTAKSLDGVSSDELARHPDRSYWLLELSCGFRWDASMPIYSAWVMITLDEPDGSAGPSNGAPYASSMEPLRMDEPMQISTEIKLDARLKLVSQLLPIDIGPSAVRTSTQVFTKHLPWVESFNEGTSKPTWYFNRTAISDVRSTHRLRMVVQTAAGQGGRGEISAGFTVVRRALGLIPYKTPGKPAPTPEERLIRLP